MQIQSRKTHKYLFIIAGMIALVAVVFFFFINTSNIEINDANEVVAVTIPDGLRKEQTADILANSLEWNTEQETKFVVKDTARDILHVEGVFPGGTYEISFASSTYEVASLFLDRAQERYQELGSGLPPKEWYEVLKVAAIAEREADTSAKMESVSQNIWQNRYDPLRSDATVQYVRDTLAMFASEPCNGQDEVYSGMVERDGQTSDSNEDVATGCLHWRLAYYGADEEYDWWQPITETDTQLKHGYNTYLYKGLPQHPIATPSRVAIEAALAARDTNEAATIPTEDETTELNDIAGTYTATLPAASSPGREVTLQLSPMQPGVVVGARASLTTDYMNGEPPIVEIGGWDMTGDGNVTVSVEPEHSADGSGNDVTTTVFSFEDNTLTAIEYDERLYGSAGLELIKE